MDRLHMRAAAFALCLLVAACLAACGEPAASPVPEFQSAPAGTADGICSASVAPAAVDATQPPDRPTVSPQASQPDQLAFIERAMALPAGSAVDTAGVDGKTLSACFTVQAIPDSVFASMDGISFKKNSVIRRKDLRYVRVLHNGFDNSTHIGELVVHQSIAKDIVSIFLELYHVRYPIEKMIRIDAYDADDQASMADNNTSAFNFRTIEGTSTLSRHAYGLAVDINPLYNPCVKNRKGKRIVRPGNAARYADRSRDCPYYIQKGDACCRLFVQYGFAWGGDWETVKDYQHFEKAE